jgi:hypothetical protein
MRTLAPLAGVFLASMSHCHCRRLFVFENRSWPVLVGGDKRRHRNERDLRQNKVRPPIRPVKVRLPIMRRPS